MTLNLGKSVSALAISAALSVTAAQAEDLSYAFGFADTYPPYPALQNYAAAIAEGTDIDLQIYPLSLLSLFETPAGIRDGMADSGWVNFAYTPVEYSESNVIANLSMVVTSGDAAKYPEAAMTGATMEYIMLECPKCIEQFAAQGQVFLAATSTPQYDLICSTEIRTPADVQGKRIRSGAGNFTRWVQHFGGTAVSLPGNEIYDSLSQGVVDCSLSSLADLIGNRYIDVVDSATLGVPGGVFSALAASNFSKMVWMALSEEDRRVILEASARLAAETTDIYHRFNTVALEQAKEQGLTIIEASDELKAASSEFVQSDLAVIEAQFTNEFKVEDVPAKLQKAQDLIEKWKELTEPVGGDLDAIAQLYWDEIYSKLDISSYGMN